MSTSPYPLRPSVVIPARNEERAVAGIVTALLARDAWREILAVDDGSTDQTRARAAAAGARLIRHPDCKDNGATVRSGIRQASGDFVLIIDADGQHRVEDASRLVSRLNEYALMVGARSARSQATWTRRTGNAVLHALAGYPAGRPIPDLTSGLGAARRDCLLEFLHLRPNGVSTPATTTLAFLKAGDSGRFEAVEAARRHGVSKIRIDPDGVRFFLILQKVITIVSPLRLFLPVSVAAFVTGAACAVWTIATRSHVTNSSVLLILVSVLILLIGLVSEQISSLGVEGRRP